jgi:hypothetical protein
MSDNETYLSSDNWGRILARAWLDEEFRKAFEADPRAALRELMPEMNIDEISVLIPLPPRPPNLSAEEIENIIVNREQLFPYMTI